MDVGMDGWMDGWMERTELLEDGALSTGQAKMNVTAGVVMYQECIQKLRARAIRAQALGIEGFNGESMGGKASFKMPAVSNVDAPEAQVWCVSHETSFLWR